MAANDETLGGINTFGDALLLETLFIMQDVLFFLTDQPWEFHQLLAQNCVYLPKKTDPTMASPRDFKD